MTTIVIHMEVWDRITASPVNDDLDTAYDFVRHARTIFRQLLAYTSVSTISDNSDEEMTILIDEFDAPLSSVRELRCCNATLNTQKSNALTLFVSVARDNNKGATLVSTLSRFPVSPKYSGTKPDELCTWIM